MVNKKDIGPAPLGDLLPVVQQNGLINSLIANKLVHRNSELVVPFLDTRIGSYMWKGH